MKGWHAFLVLEGVARITGNTPEKRLRKVEEQIAELEEQIAELRTQANSLRAQCRMPNDPPMTHQGSPNAEAGMTK
jgi:hypothetical protein